MISWTERSYDYNLVTKSFLDERPVRILQQRRYIINVFWESEIERRRERENEREKERRKESERGKERERESERELKFTSPHPNEV